MIITVSSNDFPIFDGRSDSVGSQLHPRREISLVQAKDLAADLEPRPLGQPADQLDPPALVSLLPCLSPGFDHRSLIDHHAIPAIGPFVKGLFQAVEVTPPEPLAFATVIYR